MKQWTLVAVAALGLGLGGCASDPYAHGMRYVDGSYYAEARDGYGDYYVAPEPMPDPWGDPFYDPFYGPFNDPFLFGSGGWGGYCSARYRYCPSWYDPWFGPSYGWGYGGGRGGGWGSGFSITIGSGWGYAGWHDPWRHRPGWPSPRHRAPGTPSPPSNPEAVPDQPRLPWPSLVDEAGDADAGDAGHGRPLPRPGRRRMAPDWTPGGWPSAAQRPAPGNVFGGRPDGGRRNDGGGRSEGGRSDGGRSEGGRSERAGWSGGSSEGGSGERRGRRGRTDP